MFFLYRKDKNMSSVTVKIKILDDNLLLDDSVIPTDMTVSEVIEEIVEHLSLPRRDKFGQIIKYEIASQALARLLRAEETIASAKVPSHDMLVLSRQEIAGGGDRESEGRIKFDKSSIGLSLDDLTAIDIKTLLTNEPALMMTLHSYRASLTQLEDSRQELKDSEEEIRHLNDRLKEKNIATVLLLLGQIQIGFGTNLVTNASVGGWFVFLSGLAMNIGALFFSFFGLKRLSK
jgi:hypothetical protein